MSKRKKALTEAYLKLRQHADEYRDTAGFQRAREQWEASGRTDAQAERLTLVHEWFARGVEAAARDIADLLGVRECDVELPAPVEGPNPKEQQ